MENIFENLGYEIITNKEFEKINLNENNELVPFDMMKIK